MIFVFFSCISVTMPSRAVRCFFRFLLLLFIFFFFERWTSSDLLTNTVDIVKFHAATAPSPKSNVTSINQKLRNSLRSFKVFLETSPTLGRAKIINNKNHEKKKKQVKPSFFPAINQQLAKKTMPQ